MKISAKQIQQLMHGLRMLVTNLELLKDNEVLQQAHNLLNEIVAQQSTELKEYE